MVESKEEFVDLPYKSKVGENVHVVGTEKAEEMAELVPAGSITVAVHSGPFHADEVFACALLLWTDRYHSPYIVRTRN
jgi:hypothetical protein